MKRLRSRDSYPRFKPRKRIKRAPRRGMSYVPRSIGAINMSEYKYFSSQVNQVECQEGTLTTSLEVDPTTLNTLFAPVQGNGINNREGRRVAVKGLRIKGILSQAESIVDMEGQAAVRVILFIDQQTNGAQIQSENVIEAAASNSEAVFNSFLSLDTLGRIRVLKDKVFVMPNVGVASTTASNSVLKPFKWNIKFKQPLIINFNSTDGGTVADIIDNSFHMIAMRESLANSLVNISYTARFSYIDG